MLAPDWEALVKFHPFELINAGYQGAGSGAFYLCKEHVSSTVLSGGAQIITKNEMQAE